MFEQYVNQIITWNLNRGLLGSFDPALSMKLLSEEAKEFFTATTIPEMLCEYADFWFVWHGYKAISACDPIQPVGLQVAVTSMNMLDDWALKVNNTMFERLHSAYLNKYGEDVDLYRLLMDDANAAMAFVIECNNQKSSETNEDGKIVKAENQRKPAPITEEYLEKRNMALYKKSQNFFKTTGPMDEAYDDVQNY